MNQLCFSNRCWHDRYRAAIFATTLENNNSIDESVERVILANAYILARIVLCATLAYDDITCFYFLATEVLQTESF